MTPDLPYPGFLASEFPPAKPEDALFHVIPFPLEKTVSYGGGTAKGPAAILQASQQIEAFDGNACPGEHGIATYGQAPCDEDIETALDTVSALTRKVAQSGGIPIVLGGEHTVSFAPVRGLKEAGLDFGVVQFDAHADLRDTYRGSRWSHACVMRRIYELGVPCFQIGIRSLCYTDHAFRQENGIGHLDACELARNDFPENPLPVDFPKDIYITFDVDGFDSSLMPATGTPEPGGLFWHDAIFALDKLVKGRRIIGFDVVELAPQQGLHACDFTAAKLVYTLMGLAAPDTTHG
ncbi:MAG: agmatinase [Verrucomicrobia bacterium]|nr:agmatinase [Verrucomicrobiota bacterium]